HPSHSLPLQSNFAVFEMRSFGYLAAQVYFGLRECGRMYNFVANLVQVLYTVSAICFFRENKQGMKINKGIVNKIGLFDGHTLSGTVFQFFKSVMVNPQ